jgi:hypothetical protein
MPLVYYFFAHLRPTFIMYNLFPSVCILFFAGRLFFLYILTVRKLYLLVVLSIMIAIGSQLIKSKREDMKMSSSTVVSSSDIVESP